MVGWRFPDEFDGAGETIFKTWMFLFHETCQLSIVRFPAERQYQSLHCCGHNGQEKSYAHRHDHPRGDVGRFRNGHGHNKCCDADTQ